MQFSAPPSAAWRVICLCAGWCGVCREWQPQFEQQARAHPQVHFAWVDVEDEAQAMGEMDIETFPTLLIACAHEARFLGPIPPSAPQLARLLASLQESGRPAATLPDGAQALLRRLDEQVLSATGD
jgi:thioredoxin-like negative regulator of GroEL